METGWQTRERTVAANNRLVYRPQNNEKLEGALQ